MFFKSKAQKKVEELVDHLELLAQSSSEDIRPVLLNYIAEARSDIDYLEWGMAMETLLERIYEINFRLDSKAIELTKAAVAECHMDYSRLSFIEELM